MKAASPSAIKKNPRKRRRSRSDAELFREALIEIRDAAHIMRDLVRRIYDELRAGDLSSACYTLMCDLDSTCISADQALARANRRAA